MKQEKIKSSNERIKIRIPEEISADFNKGKTTVKKALYEEAPRILAASKRCVSSWL